MWKAESPHHVNMPTPLDLAIEVLMLQRGRYLCPDAIALYNLPAAAPYFCSDWVTFLFQSVAPESLARVSDLREIFITHLDAHIQTALGEEMAMAPNWSQLVTMRRMAYEHVGHGLLASPLEDQGCGTFHPLLIRVGRCMNMASHVRQYIDTPGAGFLGQCLAYGEELCSLCAEHRQACRAACLNEGRGATSRYAPEGMLCSATPSPFFCGDALPRNYELFGNMPPPRRYEPPSIPSDPPLTLFKDGHFDPLVEGVNGAQQPPQPQQPHQHPPVADDCPRGPVGEHAGPPDAGVCPAWTRRQRQRENEQPAPIFIRNEEFEERNPDPCLAAAAEPRRFATWHVVGSIQQQQDGGGGGISSGWRAALPREPVAIPLSHPPTAQQGGSPPVPRESPVSSLSPWTPQSEWGRGGEAPGPRHQVAGRRRRRAEEAPPPCEPGYVAWGGGPLA